MTVNGHGHENDHEDEHETSRPILLYCAMDVLFVLEVSLGLTENLGCGMSTCGFAERTTGIFGHHSFFPSLDRCPDVARSCGEDCSHTPSYGVLRTE